MSEDQGLPTSQRNWVMGCVLLGIFLTGLDVAIANLALPTIAEELQSTNAATVWIVNSYQLSVTVCLLPVATLGGTLGLKRVYGFGLALFTAASLGCAMSSSLDMLVAARLVQGVGGACMAALGGALVRFIYPRQMLGRGFALIALAVALSAALGPTLAALVLSVATWPWLFMINLPLGLVAIVLFALIAPPSQPRPRPVDWAGAVLNALTFGLLVTGVDGLGGTNPRLAAVQLVASVGFGVLLVSQQSRREEPLLPLDLLRIPLFALSVITSICSYAAQILAYVALPFLFQGMMHRTAVATGLLVTPWPLLVAVVAPAAGKLSARYPASVLGSLGMATLTLGLLLLATMPALPADWDVGWRMGLCGIGFGFYQTPNNLTMMTAGPVSRSGAASGMVAVARTVGWSLGSAIVALVFGLQPSGGAVTCLYIAVGFAGLGAIVSVSRGQQGPTRI